LADTLIQAGVEQGQPQRLLWRVQAAQPKVVMHAAGQQGRILRRIGELWATIVGFTVIYGVLAVVEVRRIIRTVKKGPYPTSPDADHLPFHPQTSAGQPPQGFAPTPALRAE
jgi:cytochrome bd-type quinol oxidase subunit 1